MNRVLDAKLSWEHVEHFRIGHLKVKFVAYDDLIQAIKIRKWQNTFVNI